MSDDLHRILRYDDAIPSTHESAALREIGNEVYVLPLWTPEFCATIIRAAEAVGAFEHQPDDPVPGHEVDRKSTRLNSSHT